MLASSQDACDNQASHVAPQTEALHCKWFIVVVEWCGLQVGILAGTFKSSRWHLLEEKMAFGYLLSVAQLQNLSFWYLMPDTQSVQQTVGVTKQLWQWD